MTLGAQLPAGCAGPGRATTPAPVAVPGTACATAAGASASKSPKPPKPAAATEPLGTVRRGFFPTVEQGGKVLVVVPKGRLGRDFLLHAELTQGLAVKELSPGVGYAALNDLLVAFERRGSDLLLVRRQIDLFASEGEQQRRAVQAATSDSVIAVCPIVASLPEGSAVSLDKLLLGSLVPIEQHLEAVLRELARAKDKVDLTPQPSLSRIERTVTRPDGVIAYTQQVFASKLQLSIPGSADPRMISLRIAYHLTALPTEPMPVRLADERIGFFAIERKDLSRPYDDRPDYFIKRWRLTPGEKVGDLWRPRQPITFYLDPSIPPEFIPTVSEGVLAWNRALAAAGWQDAIAVAPLPAHAEIGDVRRSVIRWVTTVGGSRKGQARQIVDPRTGEVLGARVVIDAAALKSDYDQGRLFLPGSAPALTPATSPAEPPAAARPDRADRPDRCDEALVGGEQAALLQVALLSTGTIGTLAPLPRKLIHDRLRKTVTHEVGHALGLRHNFRASADVPMARLADPAWVREHGAASSVMDYPGLNLPRRPDALTLDFPFYSPGLGEADLLTITYGYALTEADARAAVRTFGERGYSFATDDEDDAPGAVDPLVNQHDLGDDPLQWGRERAELVRSLVPRLPGRLLQPGDRYGELSLAVSRLLTAYFRALAPLVKYVGGQYRLRDRVGDPGLRPPFTVVPKAKQRAALGTLLEYALGDNPLQLSADVLTRLGGALSGGPGLALFSDRIDYPIYQYLHAEQRDLLLRLLEPRRQQRMVDEEFKFGAAQGLTVAELHEQLTQGLWAEVWQQPRPIPPLRRDLQRVHLDLLGELLALRGPTVAYDAQASARRQLTELLRRLTTASGNSALPLATRTHLEACLAQARQLLSPPSGASPGGAVRAP